MNHTSVDFELVVDTFLLLLIGIGPKIALDRMELSLVRWRPVEG